MSLIVVVVVQSLKTLRKNFESWLSRLLTPAKTFSGPSSPFGTVYVHGPPDRSTLGSRLELEYNKDKCPMAQPFG